MENCQALSEITRAYSQGLDEAENPLPECARQAVAYYLGAWQYENDDEIDAYDVRENIAGFDLVDAREWDFAQNKATKGNWDSLSPEPQFYRLYLHAGTGDAAIVYAEYMAGHWCQCSFVLRRK